GGAPGRGGEGGAGRRAGWGGGADAARERGWVAPRRAPPAPKCQSAAPTHADELGSRVPIDEAAMILPTDIPTRAQLDGLLAARVPWSVSIYLPTDPSSRGDAERIELKNLAGEAVRQLEQAGADRKDVVAIEEEVADLIDDDE